VYHEQTRNCSFLVNLRIFWSPMRVSWSQIPVEEKQCLPLVTGPENKSNHGYIIQFQELYK